MANSCPFLVTVTHREARSPSHPQVLETCLSIPSGPQLGLSLTLAFMMVQCRELLSWS